MMSWFNQTFQRNYYEAKVNLIFQRARKMSQTKKKMKMGEKEKSINVVLQFGVFKMYFQYKRSVCRKTQAH